MKINLVSFLVSLFIHGSLVWFAYSLATELTPKPPVEKPIPLRLSMFQEPVVEQVTSVTKSQPVKVATPTPHIIQPKPVQAKPKLIKPKAVEPKSVKTKPKPVVKKLAQSKAVKPKKTPKKISKKEKKPKPVEKEVTKKQEEKPKKVVKEKVQDKALDDMILAYQATHKKQTISKRTPVTPTTPRLRIAQPQRTKVATKQVVKAKQTATPMVAKKPADNGQAEQRYKARLQRLIAQQKTYPKRARRRHQEGTVIVSFILYASGKIAQIRIKKSSGSNNLDKAALQTIQRVSGALAFPSEIKRTQWQFSLPLVYRLR